ncbi:unnamed protein product, partial [marine sediment metagenome]
RVITKSTNTLNSVTRGYGSTAKIPTAGDNLINLGHLASEGQNPPQMVMRGTDDGELYLQETLLVIGATTWEILSGKRGPKEWDRLNTQALVEFGRTKEFFRVLGAPSNIAEPTSSMPAYQTGGLRYFCGLRNVINMGNHLTYQGMANAFAHIFEFGDTKTRYGFSSQRVLSLVAALPEVRNKIHRLEQSKTLGFDVNEVTWAGGGGTVRLVELPVLNTPGLDKEMLVSSLEDLRPRNHASSPGMRIADNIQTPGALRQ